MNLVEVFEVVQVAVIWKVIETLQRGDYEDAEVWAEAKKKEYEEINSLLLSLLMLNKQRITDVILDNTEKSYKEIESYVLDQWGEGQLPERTDEAERKAIDFINTFVLAALVSVGTRKGAVERQYRRVIDKVLRTKDEEDLPILIRQAMYKEYELGLISGYIDRSGHEWALDRYVQNAQEHQTLEIWEAVLVTGLTARNVELVQIPIFSDPRQACSGLQVDNGIICVVPRHQASLEAQLYPNIYDAEHRYRQPDGHHGINCRHIWSAVGKTSRNLYKRIDKERERTKALRKRRNTLIRNLI